MKEKVKTLNHLLNISTPADQDFIYENLVKNILSRENHKITKMRTAQISLDGSDDEIFKSISETLNIPIELLDIKSIKKQIEENRLQSNETNEIIKDYLDFLKLNKAPNDKIEEAYDVGKFIKIHDPNAILLIPSDINQIPDFIITSKNVKIGIEHTRLLDSTTQKLIGTISKIIHKTRNILNDNSNTSNLLINIGFNYYESIIGGKKLIDPLSQKEIKEISLKIAHDIINYLNSNLGYIPLYINNISIDKINHSTTIHFNENYLEKENYQTLLNRIMIKKESKLSNYQNRNGLDEIWLLIINSGIKSSSSFKINDVTKVKSNFDKVFIMDDLALKIKQINK